MNEGGTIEAAPAVGEAPGWWRERSDGLGIAQSLELKLLHREQSPFQLIEIFEHEAFGRILALDGYLQASQADEFIYHEMALHVPLLGRPRRDASVLIVGGGDGGALREALVHDFVASVTMVEIDRRVIDLSADYLAVNGDYGDPRVNLVVGNAGDFVRAARAKGETFDVILLDLTEPVGPSAVLFTEDFCSALAGLVSDEGVIVDSDSIFLSLAGGHFLQEVSGGGENLVSVMRRTRLLPHIEVYRAKIPLYPGADFGFFLYSRDGASLGVPVSAYRGRHYDPQVHRAAFALPRWQRDWLGSNVICSRGILAFCVLLACTGQPAMAASDQMVNCHDEARKIVQRKLAGNCKGKAVSDAEAEAIQERRRAYIKKTLNKKAPSVTEGKRLRGIGSGFFVAADGSLVTNNHVIENCKLVMVSSATGESGPVTSIETDPANDLALLRTDLVPKSLANFAAITENVARRPIALVGYPNQGMAPINPMLTPGFFLAVRYRSPTARVLVVEADVRKGHSGGPLIDAEGKVIGVTFAQLNTVGTFENTGIRDQDIGFAIVLEDVLGFLEDHSVAYRMERVTKTGSEGGDAPADPSEAMLQQARPYMARIGCWR